MHGVLYSTLKAKYYQSSHGLVEHSSYLNFPDAETRTERLITLDKTQTKWQVEPKHMGANSACFVCFFFFNLQYLW